MSAAMITVEAYRVDDLTPAARDRLLDRERIAAWETWVTDEAGAMLVDYLRDQLDGVEGLDVTAWSLDYYPGAVVEGDVVDGRAFATSLGLPDHDLGESVSLDPHHGRGVWPGTTYVVVETDDGDDYRDKAMSGALDGVIGDALRTVSAWAHEVTSDDAILDGLREADYWYDRTGDYLCDVVDYGTTVDAPAWEDVGTWSGILDVTMTAIRTYEGREDDPVAAADRLRTLGRMLDHAATEVRDVEIAARYRSEVTS
jgi:hypothetical protein